MDELKNSAVKIIFFQGFFVFERDPACLQEPELINSYNLLLLFCFELVLDFATGDTVVSLYKLEIGKFL